MGKLYPALFIYCLSIAALEMVVGANPWRSKTSSILEIVIFLFQTLVGVVLCVNFILHVDFIATWHLNGIVQK